MNTEATTTQSYTEAQATDEAMLLLIRKTMRLHPEAYRDIWSKLPDGAKTAILAAERRADVVRDQGAGLTWAPDEDFEDAEQ